MASARPPGSGIQNKGLLIADALLTGGIFNALKVRDARQAQAAQQSQLLGAMPTPDSYAPPQYAPPVGEDGVPLDDPMARIPNATRFATWAKDYAGAGGDIRAVTDLYNATRTKTSVDGESGSIVSEDGRVVGALPRAEYINGFKVSPYGNGGPSPDFLPQLSQGTMPDGKGGVMPIPGAIAADAGREGSIAGARAFGAANATADLDFINVPGPNGETITLPKSRARGNAFVGQSPAAALGAKLGVENNAVAQAALPGVVAKADQALSVIDTILNHPGKSSRLGLRGVVPALPGTEGANFDVALKQLEGKVFLEAFESLKGGGQITQVEGEKGQQAIARLNRAQTLKEFDAAMRELRGVVIGGKTRAEQKARGGTAPAAAAPASPAVAGRPRAAPAAGTVQGGYRFNGGNPADPRNWSKM
jgi:hypothetical protein